ncbi:hypothetical protein N7539_002619 [Penicillium diatomitis]|uniref:Uncharacterized protein n=1 Tax=Penicillium diatomitis TaxID=2819901 RepID=A0A9X0BZD5_9EURO|nr:uncharacterized protein N7539_002619 [Penicillium diatomitis]KAJ5491052.1 hypothetical protein N7539_002619 [Penicillium diatomitis]
MSTTLSQSPNPSGLGDSWVVASTILAKEQEQRSSHTAERESIHSNQKGTLIEEHEALAKTANDTDQTPDASKEQIRREKELSESLASSASSWSSTGPELVMPSIYEVPISEASWVAPAAVSPADMGSPHMRKRRKITSTQINDDTATTGPDTKASLSNVLESNGQDPKASVRAKISSIYRDQQTLVRAGVNTILVTLIMHLLVFPELIYQAPVLCTLPLVQTAYPSSCVPLHPRPLPSSSLLYPGETVSPEVNTIASQTTLQAIFISTLSTLTPLSNALQDIETTLTRLHTNLQASLPEARNALDLEFQGSEAALRAASWEFNSLRADLRSATDSLLASPLAKESSDPTSIARDTRLASQLRRRGEYLDRLRTQLRNKADSLGGRFATLDDHLEAIGSIVSREARHAWMEGKDVDAEHGAKNRGEGLLQSLSSYAVFSARFFGAGSGVRSGDQPADTAITASSGDEAAEKPTSTLALLRLVSTQHRAVADEIARLAKALREEQRARYSHPW